MDRLTRAADRLAWIGLAVCGLGISIVVVRSWVEYLTTPGAGLVDGYWSGSEPWSSLGVVPTIAGATLAVLAAAVLVTLTGDWVRRLLLVPLLALPAYWWATALGLWPFPRFVGPDPVTFAYSLPQQAVITLLLPAVAACVLAWLPRRPDTRVRLRPVHGPDEAPPPRDEG